MPIKIAKRGRGHALTSFDGRFLSADDTFTEIVARNSARLQQLSITDITHETDHGPNHQLLARLRETGEPFEIVKKYVQENGRVIPVRNHVSLFRDGLGPARLIASTDVLNPIEQSDERRQLSVAIALLGDRIHKIGTGPFSDMDDQRWRTLLALYILEQKGARTLLSDVSDAAAIGRSEGNLIILELMGRNIIDLDYKGAGLEDSSAVLTASARSFLTKHFATIILDVFASLNFPS